MKTLTFEELIKNYETNPNYQIDLMRNDCYNDTLNLLKQVRLATLEECANKADADFNIIKVNDNSLENNIEVYVLKHSILDLDKNSIEIN